MSFKNLLTKINPFKNKDSAVITESATLPIENQDDVNGYPKKSNIFSDKMWTLSETDKQIVVSLWASGLTPSEVVEQARLEHNIKISYAQVNQYSHAAKWQPLIKKIKEATYSDLSSIAGSHKKVRLARHEKVYDRAISKNKLQIAMKATEYQRREMEGDSTNVSLTMNQFNVLSDDELEYKKKQVMERIKLITQGESK